MKRRIKEEFSYLPFHFVLNTILVMSDFVLNKKILSGNNLNIIIKKGMIKYGKFKSS